MLDHANSPYLLEAKNVVKHYPIRGGVFFKQVTSVKAVDGVSLNIRRGETLGLVGSPGAVRPLSDGLFCGWKSPRPVR